MPRNPKVWFLTGLLVLGMCSWSNGQGTKNATAGKDDLWAQFQVVVERNIFSRQRGRPSRKPERVAAPERPRYTPTPESLVVLKGIVKENGQFVAFFENTGTGSILRIHAGEPAARGKVEALTLDHVVFSHEDQTRIVILGQNLEGRYGSGNVGLNEALDWTQNAASVSSAGNETAYTPSAGSADESDILKKLMERRRQQLGD